jgi:hypothetical protein
MRKAQLAVAALGAAMLAVVAGCSSSSPSSSPPPPAPVPNPSRTLAGVTLSPIDGGPHYYCSHGFTYACEAGWDNPSFFPIGIWYGTILSQSDVNRWKDLGINTAFRTTANTDLPLLRSNGLFAIVADDGSGPETPGLGSETVGLLSYDEPSTYSAGVSMPLSSVPDSVQDGRFWYINDTWNFLAYGGLSPVSSSAEVLSNMVSTPNGTPRHIDINSVDMYWFAGASGSLPYEGQILYRLKSLMPQDEVKCGCRYGDQVDALRALQHGHDSAPIAQFVEDGGPYTQDTAASDYITPPEMNWAVWSSIIHGARMIVYFNHSFAGPAPSDDNFAQGYYQTVQPGQTTSIYAQAKATDALIAKLAPVINSPTASGYLSVSPPARTFSGIETMVKYYNGHFYIFADTRDTETASSIHATFTIKDASATSVAVVGENRTLPVTGGSFSDTFASGSTVHIYEVN